MSHRKKPSLFTEDEIKAMRKVDRRIKWKRDQFALGNCIECGRDRKGSPYKKVCMICASKARYRSRQKQGGEPWKQGMPGRPPLMQAMNRRRTRAKKVR